MELEEAVNKLIRDSIDLLLQNPGYTIKAKQKDAPRPVGPYATVDFVTDNTIGKEQRIFENNDLDPDMTENISGQREIMMSVNFFRDDAMDNSRKVRTGLIRESIQSLFSQAGIGLISRSEVRDIDDPTKDGWEERSQLDIVVNAVGTDSDIVTSILEVDIESEFQIRGLVYNSSIEVQ